MATELPGFQSPGSPNADVRGFSPLGARIELPIYDNVPLANAMPQFEIFIEKAFGTQVELLATADNAQIIVRHGTNPSTKAYWLSIFPDELRILRGTYRIRVNADGKEVFRQSISVGHDP